MKLPVLKTDFHIAFINGDPFKGLYLFVKIAAGTILFIVSVFKKITSIIDIPVIEVFIFYSPGRNYEGKISGISKISERCYTKYCKQRLLNYT